MISAIVPTYRGQARLSRNLPSVVASLEASGAGWEVIVVDDGGGQGGSLPQGCRWLVLDRNRGYGPAVNAGAAGASGDFLLVLNDDVALETDTVRSLRALFPDPDLFAVVPSIRSSLAACGDEGGKRGVWKAGLIEVEETVSDRVQPTLYPVGCCFLCPRQAFLDLGGYDDLYAPFFFEDVDLGYRVWRRGLRCLHVPHAICHHEGSATLKEQRTYEDRVRMFFRNSVLFHLRNLQDRRRRAANYGAWLAHALFEGREDRRQGLAEAIAAMSRAGPRTDGGLSDDAILARVVGTDAS